jgi:hypothetical protein
LVENTNYFNVRAKLTQGFLALGEVDENLILAYRSTILDYYQLRYFGLAKEEQVLFFQNRIFPNNYRIGGNF